ncbi:hypothetical protein HMI54_002042 [Coelomomyces lativittatus]|nr:hypothetical protein HMI54_002042 [Coelomomyces lativittatus]
MVFKRFSTISKPSNPSPSLRTTTFPLPTSDASNSHRFLDDATPILSPIQIEWDAFSTPKTSEVYSDTELNEQFEKLLMEMALTPDKMKTLQDLPKDKKFFLLQQHNTQKQPKPSKTIKGKKSPEESAMSICEGIHLPLPTLAMVLNSLEVAVRTEPISWMTTFLKQTRGCAYLFRLVEHFAFQKYLPAQGEVRYLLARIFKAMMNNSQGLHAVVMYPYSVQLLWCLYDMGEGNKHIDAMAMRTKMVIMELMSVLALMQGRHDDVLDAFEFFRSRKNQPFKFTPILKDLLIFNTEFQETALTLINALILSPANVEVRAHLRSEFLDQGLDEILKSLASTKDPTVLNQLQLFYNEAQHDSGTYSWATYDANEVLQQLYALDGMGRDLLLRLVTKILTLPDTLRLRHTQVLHRVLNRLILNSADTTEEEKASLLSPNLGPPPSSPTPTLTKLASALFDMKKSKPSSGHIPDRSSSLRISSPSLSANGHTLYDDPALTVPEHLVSIPSQTSSSASLKNLFSSKTSSTLVPAKETSPKKAKKKKKLVHFFARFTCNYYQSRLCYFRFPRFLFDTLSFFKKFPGVSNF